MLRSIVAIALVATALSAPTWTQQLKGMPQLADNFNTQSNGAESIDNCNCDDCTHPFATYGGPVNFC